jgi:hypothetical protein
VTGSGTQPLDMAYADGFLYALTPGDGGIHAFSAEDDGRLVILPNSGIRGMLPVSVTGLAAY